MKTTSQLAILVLATSNLFIVTMQAQDYTYETDNATITITGYTGPGGNVIIPDTINGLPVTSIGGRWEGPLRPPTYIGAFSWCTNLTNVTIPTSVTSIGDAAFAGCASLSEIYFQGGAPSIASGVFNDADAVTVYYLPGTTGWTTTFAGRPTALWALPYPLILSNGPSFGVQTNRFGFLISWATNISVVVESSSTLVTPTWIPITTNTLTGGSSYFSDPLWTNYPARFYRVRQWSGGSGVTWINTRTIYIDSAAVDADGQVGVSPFQNITNAFKLITNNTVVVMRGEWTLPLIPIDHGNGYVGHGALNIENVTNVLISAENATLRWAGRGWGITMSNVAGITLQGLTMIGDRTSSNYLEGAIGMDQTVLSTGITFERCKFINWIDHGISAVRGCFNTDNLTVSNCYFDNIGMTAAPPWMIAPGLTPDGTCISGLIGNNCRVTDNYATNCLRFFEFENGGAELNGRKYNIHVERNTARYLHAAAIIFYEGRVAGNSCMAAENVWIKDNTFEYTTTSSWIFGTETYEPAMVIGQGKNFYIEGNTVSGNRAASIWLGQSGTNALDNVYVRGNTLIGTNQLSSVGTAAIIATSAAGATAKLENLEITGNTFEGSVAAIFAGARRTKINNNRFIKCGSTGYPYLITSFSGLMAGFGYNGLTEELIVSDNDWVSVRDGCAFFLLMGTQVIPLKTDFENNNMIGGAGMYYAPISFAEGAFLTNSIHMIHRRDTHPLGNSIYASPGSVWYNTAGNAAQAVWIREAVGLNDTWVQ